MSLITRINQPFASLTKDSAIQGNSIVFIKGGSTIINGNWLQFNDLRIDVQALVESYISQQATRIFNTVNGILYVVITLNQSSKLEVIPSISLNQTTTGSVKVFSSLSGRLPLMLVTLQQDGSNDLSSIIPITADAIEVYKGYGNFTLIGQQGETGPQGDTGIQNGIGLTGLNGLIGEQGITGCIGSIGENGVLGATGLEGQVGVSIPREVFIIPVNPIANFVGVPLSVDQSVGVAFTNLSLGDWNSLLWDFGDGSTSTDSSNPIIHAYDNVGVYTVTLYLYGVGNNSSSTGNSPFTVIEPYDVQDTIDPNNPYGTWTTVIGNVNVTQNSVVP
jgi:hypothetical protein